MASIQDDFGYLAGRLLIATPSITESCFHHSVIYMCAHNQHGAMGLIVNLSIDSINPTELFKQLNLDSDSLGDRLALHFGGPVETNRGFVLHGAHTLRADSISHHSDLAVTANAAILNEIAEGKGPQPALLMLGYAGWDAGQLESEIEGGSWICVPASREIIFHPDNDMKWSLAAATLGVDMSRISPVVGHA